MIQYLLVSNEKSLYPRCLQKKAFTVKLPGALKVKEDYQQQQQQQREYYEILQSLQQPPITGSKT